MPHYQTPGQGQGKQDQSSNFTSILFCDTPRFGMEITTSSMTKHKASRIDKDLRVEIFPRVNIQSSQTIVTEYKPKDKTQFYFETNPKHIFFRILITIGINKTYKTTLQRCMFKLNLFQ